MKLYIQNKDDRDGLTMALAPERIHRPAGNGEGYRRETKHFFCGGDGPWH